MSSEICNIIKTTLTVEESLEDIVTDEFNCAVFECKLSDNSTHCNSYRWYKDGKCIEHQPRIQISSNGIWHRLEITLVTVEDEGVYSIIIKNDLCKVFSCANLYVKAVKHGSQCNNDILCMSPSWDKFPVQKHLLNTKVLVGATVELEFILKDDVIGNCLWYKGSKLLQQDERIIILSDSKTSTLSILYSKETDTGIYYVVSKTKHGILSSHATVIVMDIDLSTLNSCETTPYIVDPLPDEIETNEGEEIRLVCKALYSTDTIIDWSKNGTPVENNENIYVENCNNHYICLRILKPSFSDTGEYSVQMQNEITGQQDSCSCFLTVNKLHKDTIVPIKLTKSLQPTISCCGSRLLLTCSFDLVDPQYYFVVWYIGHFRVERTNHRFHVFNSKGDFYLFIKQIEPSMAGEITCELHRSLPNRKKVLVNKTTSYLSIVPQAFLDVELNSKMSDIKQLIYNRPTSKLIVSINLKKCDENGIDEYVNSSDGVYPASHESSSILELNYCRFDDKTFYLDAWNIGNETFANHLEIYEKESDIKAYNSTRVSRSTVIEWSNSKCENKVKNRKKWYMIEFCQCGNDYVEAGISSLPIFELKDPPLEQVMSFRIKPVDPFDDSSENTVCIIPAAKESHFPSKTINLQEMENFTSQFTKTGDVIGSGAFGSVFLVRDSKNNFYAAKVIKTRTQKKRDTALREYEMMKNLRHPKLVELVDSFVAKDSFVIVMDYLWGGELFDRIVEEEHIKEVDVVPYVRQLCEALQYLHERKIAHLDLKPENIICLSPNSRQVKIIDFGLARVIDDVNITRAIYGTKDYIAPEVLNFERLSLASDMWSLGVVTYMLLSGVMPFSGESWPERSANITMANYNYDESAFKDISDLAKDFVDHLLILQPEKRMKASVALNHQWIVEGPPEGAKSGQMRRARENLKSYLANYRARWQRAGNVMIAAHRLRRHMGIQRTSVDDTDRESQRVT